MKFDNKLIVSDIDGTLFDDTLLIAERNIDAINYFKENGGLFTFATGRCDRIVQPELVKLANAPIICCNGAYIYDFEADRRSNEICIAPGPAISMINTVIESFPGVSATITADRKYYIVGAEYNFDKEAYGLTDDDIFYLPLEQIPTNQWYSVVFNADEQSLDLVNKYISVAGENMYHISRSWATMLEINNIRATKGKAAAELKRFCENHAHNTPITLYGIGDYENDIDLLTTSDVSACPENAVPAVKEIAQIQLCSNNDGAVADLIEYIDANM